MISQLGQVMVYVNDQDEARQFWTQKLGFAVVAEQDNGQGFRWIEVAPASGQGSSIVLHNKQFVAKMSPGLHLGTPSLMFYTDELDALYRDLSGKGVTVGEVVEMPGAGRVFNFADGEQNYFAVMERM